MRFQPEPVEEVLSRYPGNAHDFPAAPQTGDDLHAKTGNIECGGKEPDECHVGPIFEGGRGETDADRISGEPRHPFPRCAGQHVDRDRGGLLSPFCLPPFLSFQESTAAKS
jgi:hypothetical protein